MNIAILYSAPDPAGRNIARFLDHKSLLKMNVTVHQLDKDHLFTDNIAKDYPADLYIFASRHRSDSGKPCFSAHPLGNWGKNEAGGLPNTLSMSSSHLLKHAIMSLHKEFGQGPVEVTLEATHHGPFMDKPAIFMEIGSSEKEWTMEENGRKMASAITHLVQSLQNPHEKDETEGWKTAIALGGMHYSPAFTKILLNANIAISHICPKHNLHLFNERMLEESIRKSVERIDFILLDWKGLCAEKQRILEMLKNKNIDFRRTDKIK